MVEHDLAQLHLPSLTAQRRVLKDGTVRYVVLTCSTVWDDYKHRAVITHTKAVGVVEDDRAFGRVLFKADFLQEFPQLKEVTVLRKADRHYVYVQRPLTSSDYHHMYHQRGRRAHGCARGAWVK